METITRMLSELGFSAHTRAVYLDLLSHGESSPRMIAERISMPRPSVYDHLSMLRESGLVSEKEKNSKAVFAIGDVSDLSRLLSERVEQLSHLRKDFDGLKGSFQKKGESGEPKIKFFDGHDGLVRLYRDLLWESDTLIETVWPHERMAKILGNEELLSFNKKRIKNKIHVRTIWPHGSKPKAVDVWKGGDWGVERKIAPKGYMFDMQYSIYGDKVAFISSEKELFGFTVASREFANLMRMQFRALWSLSR